MRKIYSLVLVVLMLVSASFSFAQVTSLGRAPEGQKMPISISNDNPLDANNRGFVYLSGTSSHQWNKQFMGSVTVTPVGAPFTTASWVGATTRHTNGTIYVCDQAAPFEIWTLDTTTGAATLVTSCTGVPHANFTGMAWDHTTNTMYGLSSDIATTALFTINLSTGVCTQIGTTAATCAGGIGLYCAPNGSLFVDDIVGNNLYKYNKTTGVATLVGALNFDANYGQDGAFDLSDGKLYLASAGPGNILRLCDTTTGDASVVIGTYSAQPSCLTIIASAGPTITHTPLPNTQNVAGPYIVNASITPQGSTIAGTKVYWSRNNAVLTDSVIMTNSSGTNWTGNIPGNGSAAIYRYQIRTIQVDGKTGQTGVNQFTASATDTIRPVIVTTPLGDTPKSLWPVSVTATVTDNIGVDSAWVVWRINSGVNKMFKLTNTSGNTYSSLFNSVNADVVAGNVITYRVFAQDNSAQHNRDSSASMSFNIINLVNACIGTGAVSSNYPFTTYWGGGRTQMLFTAAEITAAGGVNNALVNKVGFNVLTRDPGVMNQFNVNIQNTTATTLTTYITTGWTNIYTGTYTVPATGWQYIDCPSSTFHWNGTNLLLEICYTNPSYTQYSTVASTTMTGMQLGYYMDAITGCSTAVYNTVTARPNVCFTMIPALGVTPNVNTIPTVYSLSQNYPNPFNPVTKINFALPKQGMVTLKIYDVLGREVRTLVNEVKSAGNFSVDFNASEYASGVYFYRLESNGFSDIKRMMLIK